MKNPDNKLFRLKFASLALTLEHQGLVQLHKDEIFFCIGDDDTFDEFGRDLPFKKIWRLKTNELLSLSNTHFQTNKTLEKLTP